MALYEVSCPACQLEDVQWQEMPRSGGLPSFDSCRHCGGPVRKVYRVPADHSDNSFRPRWSDNLSTTGEPVYVKTGDEYRQLKSKLGLTEHEPGMSQDKKRRDQERQQKAIDQSFNKIFGGLAP